ncbi:MAG: hypothetical protein JW746_10280 [Candidatus Krumholzibacteriota bacterium]|nr:hypothetical protein [Candidatus Krumholzibacteriota bacterium]
MEDNKEIKILARGLETPSVLLLVKRSISGITSGMVRIIVSNEKAVGEVRAFFKARGVETEVDIAGDDFHLLLDMNYFKEVY